jgi:MFS family permease
VSAQTVQRRVLLVAVLISFVSFLDGTVVNVALPAIAGELGGPGPPTWHCSSESSTPTS